MLIGMVRHHQARRADTGFAGGASRQCWAVHHFGRAWQVNFAQLLDLAKIFLNTWMCRCRDTIIGKDFF